MAFKRIGVAAVAPLGPAGGADARTITCDISQFTPAADDAVVLLIEDGPANQNVGHGQTLGGCTASGLATIDFTPPAKTLTLFSFANAGTLIVLGHDDGRSVRPTQSAGFLAGPYAVYALTPTVTAQALALAGAGFNTLATASCVPSPASPAASKPGSDPARCAKRASLVWGAFVRADASALRCGMGRRPGMGTSGASCHEARDLRDLFGRRAPAPLSQGGRPSEHDAVQRLHADRRA